MDNPAIDQPAPEAPEAKGPRKPWTRPVLTTATVSDVTQGGGPQFTEGGYGS